MNKEPDRAYISTITGVREVALTGTADLAYWRVQLEKEGLVPLNDGGRATLMLTAIEARFGGIPFRELSISVLVSENGDANAGGAYLAHAFNSSRLLAFAERAIFRTPYQLADLAVDERVPARMAVAVAGRELFNAQMGRMRDPARREDAIIEGPIYLPGRRDVFYARLSGAGDVYFFDEADALFIRPAAKDDVFTRLVESDFAGKEWLVRDGAVHARSKSYRRGGDGR